MSIDGAISARRSLPATRRGRKWQGARESLVAYLLLSPSLLVIFGFAFVPLVWGIYYSFVSGGLLGEQVFVGLDNYRKAIDNPIFLRTVRNTLKYAVMVVPTAVVVSLVVALLLQQVATQFQGLFRGAVYFPVVVPAVVAANAWAYLVNRDFGPLNYVLGLVGISKVDWLGDPQWAIPTVVMMEVWRGFGFYVIIIFAALQAIPKEVYEAAQLDGAGALRRVWTITLPLLRPILGFVFIVATIWNLQLFDAIYVLTKGGPAWSTSTVSWYIYQQAFQSNNIGFASTMSVFLLVGIMVLSLIQLRLFRSDVEY